MRVHFRVAVALCAVGFAAIMGGCGGGGDFGTHSRHGGGSGRLLFSQDNNSNGLFQLDLGTGAATLVGTGATATTSSTIGLTETADPTLLLGSTYLSIAEIATDGSGATVISGSADAEGLAMHIGTGVLFSAINEDFRTLDPTTGAVLTGLATPPQDVDRLGVDPDGNVKYAFYVYDIGTNNWSQVGDTGIDWEDPGLAFDHLNGVAYATDAGTGSLYRIDPGTGAATLVGSLGTSTSAGGGVAFVVD